MVAPILNILGWRVSHPEFWFIPATRDDADARMVHALRSDAVPDRTLAVIETRALGADIIDGIEFHLQRCIDTGVAIFAITDGRFWHLYPILEGVTPGKPTAVCDLFSGNPCDVQAMTMLECKTPAFVHSPSK
ncbi:MAG: hypothetical protein OXC83_04285 [Chloroflexi bacterium]|nr:hypothetical protein [Chloroflexota bacterium]